MHTEKQCFEHGMYRVMSGKMVSTEKRWVVLSGTHWVGQL